MELVFLKRSTLAILDHAHVSDDFELVIDSVIYQKSNFVVNRTGIKAVVGDIVILRGTSYFYIGIIEAIEVKDEFQTKIETNDFTSIFDLKVPVGFYNGDVGSYLLSLISKTFKTNDDPLQNLNYLTLSKSASVYGTIFYEDNELKSITEVSELLAKTYGVRFNYSLIIDIDGRISGINVDIASVTSGLKIKSNLPCITSLEITESKSQVTNKVIFYPKSDNLTYTSIVGYYLLTNGTITNNKSNVDRFPYVKSTSAFYSDNEYSTLLTKAQSELLKSNLEHSIEFKVNMDNSIIIPFKNLKVGDFVEFVTDSKTYDTMVTQLSFKGNFYECSVVLGEYRVKLTDKIKLLERK